jgi:cell division protease FtsH
MHLLPIDRGTPAPRASPPLPRDVATTLSHLANLIDDEILVRGVGIATRDFAASFLRVSPPELAQTTELLGLLDFQLVGMALAELLEAVPPAALIGSDMEEPPDWERLELGERAVRIPSDLAAAYPAGAATPCPLVVQVHFVHWRSSFELVVFARREHEAEAATWLGDLVTRGRAGANPFRNQVLEAKATRHGLAFEPAAPLTARRDELVLPDAVWAEVDRNVGGLFASLPRLRAAGLGRNRGVLLAGPPGTGKTALCRVLARELAGSVTVVFCDAKAVAFTVRQLYEELRHLAPALVVMEDVDLVIADRSTGGSQALVDFLLALDGAMSLHEGVVTVATTNAAGSIDAAAKRSSRFDVEIAVPAPDASGRVAILRRYLRELEGGAEVDVRRVAASTEGCTGADLRELVGNAVLHLTEAEGVGGSGAVGTALLLRLARERGGRRPGQYL